ncbi:MAG: hypothetical protein OET81_12365, partial [Desulfobacteraceae bacterium]|nr:hypothetical protein [Desulfobacteraceae bacterium]
MERWSAGVLDFFPSLQHSGTPLLQSFLKDAAHQLKNISDFHPHLAYFSQSFNNYLLKFKIFLD